MRVRPPGWWLNVLVLVILVPVYLLTVFGAGNDATWVRVLFAVLAVLVVASILATVRAGLRATPDGLTARLVSGRTRQFAWAEIAHFDKRGYWRGVGIWTVEGRWVRLMPYGAFDAEASTAVAHLEDYRWARQQQLGLV